MAVAVLAVAGGTRVWCRGCDSAAVVRMHDKHNLICASGHYQHAYTPGLALSIDDDETPPRLVPPKEYRF